MTTSTERSGLVKLLQTADLRLGARLGRCVRKAGMSRETRWEALKVALPEAGTTLQLEARA